MTKDELINSIDRCLHDLCGNSDPAVKEAASMAHRELHDLAALVSDDPEIRNSVA